MTQMATHAPSRPTLTDEELALVALLRGCWSGFSALPDLRPADLNEAALHLQALHRIVASRAPNEVDSDDRATGSAPPVEPFWQTQAPCPPP
jgi:hypothetical protein